jgi:asparagine synthase (glutamine-hydrolysing)
MCGIAGYVSTRVDVDLGPALRAMAATIAHRGPDDEGFFETVTRDGKHRVGVAIRRLSIIDLSTGHQPVGNEDGSVQIVFNGEVYNFLDLRKDLEAKGHRFATNSDTETIVHAYEEWGEACVERLRGMFAFAIWDARRERMFLARDRFGKKPLYLHEGACGLAFASEIKSLLVFPGVERRVDMCALWEYYAYRYVPAPATLFAGIRKLMPGCFAVWEAGTLKETRYYRPPDRDPSAVMPVPDDPVGAFLAKLDESVRIRMISDVPFGAFLSGGIDSSAVVGLMSRHSNQPIKTFSMGFALPASSELDYARTIAKQFGSDHHELTISQDHLMEHLPALVRFRDAPVAEPSDIPIYLLSKEARKTVKMVLTGEGGDEILGGYPKHVFERYASLYQMAPAMLRRGLFEPAVGALPYRFRRAKTAIVTLGLERFEERMPRWFGALSDREREDFVGLPAVNHQGERVQFDTPSQNSTLRRILYFDQTSWLPDNLLERGDSMTMAASLESRMPFMDHKLAALVSSLPDNYRVRGMTTKWILREAMKRLLPSAILGRPKVGFRVPVDEWFRGPMRDYLMEHLTGKDSRTKAYYHRPILDQTLADHINGRQNHEKLLWCLLSLEIWHREYGVA